MSDQRRHHGLSEKEISELTCIVRNLSRNIPAQQAEQEIKDIFDKSLPHKIVCVRVTAPWG